MNSKLTNWMIGHIAGLVIGFPGKTELNSFLINNVDNPAYLIADSWPKILLERLDLKFSLGSKWLQWIKHKCSAIVLPLIRALNAYHCTHNSANFSTAKSRNYGLAMDVILLPSNSEVNFLENKILRKQALLQTCLLSWVWYHLLVQ